MNRDQWNNVDASKTAVNVMRLIDANQGIPAHEQASAIAALFVLLNDGALSSPIDTYLHAKNLMNYDGMKRVEFRAAVSYIEENIR